MLAELMRLRYGIAVAGAHGKTTTTSMIALVLERAGLDPTAVIGGRLSAFGSNARLGRGELMVAEADESDRSFLKLSPTIAVITNIDHEHLEHYGGFDDLQQAFVDFANKVPFYGAVVACADDPLSRVAAAHDAARGHLRPRRDGRRRSRRPTCDLDGFGARCTVDAPRRGAPAAPSALGHADARRCPAATTCRTRWPPWRSASSSACRSSGIAAALAEFHGAERRFERARRGDGVLVVDDYGHHPTEIAAVLAAARAARPTRSSWRSSRTAITRTRALMDEFGAGARRGRRGGAHRHLRGRRRADSRASRSRRWPRR